MVSQKKVLSVKIDPDRYDDVKTRADVQHVPMADIIIQSLDADSRNEHLKEQNRTLQRRLDDMQRSLEQVTGRKSGKSSPAGTTLPPARAQELTDAILADGTTKAEYIRIAVCEKLDRRKSGKLELPMPQIPALS